MDAGTRITTELRREVLETLARYVFCSRPQLYRLIQKRGEGKQETWERAVRRALELAERAGYVTHGALFEESVSGARKSYVRRWVHYLTKRGADELAVARAVGSGQLVAAQPVPYYVRKPASLPHEESLTEDHLNLELGLRAHRHLRLHAISHDLKKGVQPDRIFGIQNTNRPRASSTQWLMWETERSRPNAVRLTTEAEVHGKQSGIIRKLLHYDNYRRAGNVTRDWPFIVDFHVVVVVETNRRMSNLLIKLQPLLPKRFIWITSRELVKDEGVLARVFYTPKNRLEAHSLLDIAR